MAVEWDSGEQVCSTAPCTIKFRARGRVHIQVAMSDTLSIRGMPKGNREVAAAIAAAGDALVMTEDGRYASRRDVVANAVWEVLLTGELTLSDGSAVRVDSISEWFSILKWVGAHLDGPPVTLADARSTNMVVRVVYDEEPPYPEDAAPLAGAAVYENGS